MERDWFKDILTILHVHEELATFDHADVSIQSQTF